MSSGRKKRHIKKAVKKKALRKSRFWVTVRDGVQKNSAHIIFSGECDLLAETKILNDLLVLIYGELKGQN